MRKPRTVTLQQSITVAPLSMEELLSPRVEGICINQKFQKESKCQATISKVEWFVMELEQGNWFPLRNQLLALKVDPDAKNSFLDRVAARYRTKTTPTSNSSEMAWRKGMDEWCHKEPENPDGFLLYGQLWITEAWSALRQQQQEQQLQSIDQTESSSRTSLSMQVFHQRQELAQQKLKIALQLDPTDPLIYVNLLTATRELKQLKATFTQFRQDASDPHNLLVHQTMLVRLSPHWGGSIPEMIDFARECTLRPTGKTVAPPLGHELWTLLPQAHYKAWHYTQQQQQQQMDASDKSQDDAYFKNMRVADRKEIVKAYRKYRSSLSATNDADEVVGNDLFAFCLYQVRAYREAHAEFERIGDVPLNPQPWHRAAAGGNKTHLAVYAKARAKVAAHVSKKNSQQTKSARAMSRQVSVEVANAASRRVSQQQATEPQRNPQSTACNDRSVSKSLMPPPTVNNDDDKPQGTHPHASALQRQVSVEVANAAATRQQRRQQAAPRRNSQSRALQRQVSVEVANAAQHRALRRQSSAEAAAQARAMFFRRTASKEAAALGRKKALLFQCK
ncbi:expressed unknown protein [Seminavis robusta]|uniref:Uncharacterized protein n=1 Tax=Seminavis robusta TaxID=568900 RepID=A0A9N8DSX4_9STRA|nr:expressed unknown protein [Seminavis robusta]|eukprot:Sro265_g102930.1 n/a (563) ;mRNA; r:71944-73730